MKRGNVTGWGFLALGFASAIGGEFVIAWVALACANVWFAAEYIAEAR